MEYQRRIWEGLHAADEARTKVLSPVATAASSDAKEPRSIPSADEARTKTLSTEAKTDAADAKKPRQISEQKCKWDNGCKPTHSQDILFDHGVFSLVEKVETDATMLRDKACHTVPVHLTPESLYLEDRG